MAGFWLFFLMVAFSTLWSRFSLDYYSNSNNSVP